MKETKKQLQVASLIQKEFSHVLQVEGSFIYGQALVTVTRVRMSADLGIAYMYFSVYNSLHKQEVIQQLWEHLPRLRGELGKRISSQVRRIPMLKFFIDDSLDEAEHLNQLFAQLHQGDTHRSMKEAQEDKTDSE
jgi:ribosome-binding factor A